MAYEMIMFYHLHMPLHIWGIFTEYPKYNCVKLTVYRLLGSVLFYTHLK